MAFQRTRCGTDVRRSVSNVGVVGSLLATLALLAGCASSSGDSAPAGDATNQEKSGGEIVYLDAEATKSTQLQDSGSWQDSAYIENIADRLVWKDPDTGEFQPYIATDWDISEDGRQYTFTIKDGVTYSDGSPLDAESVKRNLEWQTEGDEDEGVPPSSSFPEVDSITTAGNEVTVSLVEPFADFLDVLSGWSASLVSDATIDAPLESQQQITGIIGSGPFEVESEKYGEELVLTKREGYDWGPSGVGHTGEAYLDRITIRAVTDDTVRAGTLKADQADLIRYMQPADERVLAEDGYQIFSARGIGATNQWVLEQSIPELQDVNVRRAISFGIDREELRDSLYTDNWKPAQSIVTEDTVGFTDKSDQLEFDPDEANALLDDAGYTGRDDDGYRTKDGKRLHLNTVIDVYDSTAKPLYQKIQAQLKRIGIDLDLREADYSQVSEAYAAPDVAATRTGWPYPAPWVTLRTAWHSEGTDAFAPPEPDERLDELFDAQSVETDPDKRAELLKELQDHVVDNAYSVPLLQDSQIFGAKESLQDFGWTAEARPYFYDVWTSAS